MHTALARNSASYLRPGQRQTHLGNSRQTLKPIPVFSLISQLTASMRDYCRSEGKQTWLQFLSCSKRVQILGLLLQSWQFHSAESLQCQLLSGLLQQSDRRKLQLYLRLRKYISQLSGSEQLDSTLLRYQDGITIIHRMFPAAIRREISLGLKQIFIAYKVADAKIFACVLIEFILSIYDCNAEQQSLMAGEAKSIEQIQLSNFSTISKFNSSLVKESRSFKGRQPDPAYEIIEAKFIPTDSQQFGSKPSYFNHHERQDHYYYSNSLNFQQQQLSKASSIASDKENCAQSVQKSSSASSKSLKRQHFEPPREILIQDSQSASHSEILEDSIPLELKEMAVRNREFKKRMLSLKGQEGELSSQDELALKKTIHIIHSSVVRNLPYK